MQHLPAPELPGWLEAMVPFERYRVDVGDYRMHVMEHGQGRPVLMVHGNPTWGFLYRKVTLALEAKGLRAVMPDLIGLGYSDKPRDPEEHQLEGHARYLGRLVEALDLKDLILVVQDWGGPIGLRALSAQRERLAGLVILNTAIGPPRPGFRATAFHRFARMPLISDLVFRGLGFPQIALGRAQGDPASIQGEVARAYRHPLRHFSDRVAPLALARMVPDSPDHVTVPGLRRVEDFVKGLDCPIEVVWGQADPVLGRVLSHVRRVLPNARVTATEAGHFLQEEVPSEIAAAIARVAENC